MLGQATFEITAQGGQLFIKHTDDVRPDPEAIDKALQGAGDFQLVPRSQRDFAA